MDFLTVLVIALANIACFYLGSYIGQRVVKGDRIEAPSFHPIKTAKENREKDEAKAEQERLDKIMRNIENYNGTESGQEDV